MVGATHALVCYKSSMPCLRLSPFWFGAVLLAQVPEPSPAPSTVGPAHLQLADYLEWESVAEPRLSPDGRSIVFTRTWFDAVEDRPRQELWLMQADGSQKRHLAAGSDAQWSPDGTRIAYLAEGVPRGTQIFVVYVATREASQLTHATEAPANLQWSPDGRWLACTMQVQEREALPIDLPKPPKGAKWHEDAKVITRLQYRRDHSGYRPSGYRHLFVVPADGGTPRQVSQGDFDHGAPQWTPDGKELVCEGRRFADADWRHDEQDLYAIAIADGAVRELVTRPGSDSNPVVCGDQVVFLGADAEKTTYRPVRAYAVALAGGELRPLTPRVDRSLQDLRRAAAQRLLCSFEDQGALRTAHLGLDGGFEPETPLHGWFRGAARLPDGGLLGTWTAPDEPGAIAVWRAQKLQLLTAVHDDVLAGKRLGRVEERRWQAPDGTEVQGWLVYPPDFQEGRKYPLVLQIHGGPHAMYGVNFDFERQWLAAKGYLLLYCNPRGSTGYGAGFANAIQNAYPGKDYDDLMAGVDHVLQGGAADPERLCVYGGSGGGVLTCWIIGSNDRFRAAVSMFPVTNWLSFVGTTDGPGWYDNFRSLPWQDATEHWQRSPLRLVGNVKTPTLLLTGELDLRTPMSQSEEYYQALRLRKVDAALVRIQDEYHGAGLRHPSNRLRRMAYTEAWFRRHLPADPSAPK